MSDLPGIDPWPTDDDMAERCGGVDGLIPNGCGHTLGQHHYGADLAPCHECPCEHFR